MAFIGTKSFVEAYSARLTFCFLSAAPGLVRIPLGVVVRATPTFHVSKISEESSEKKVRDRWWLGELPPIVKKNSTSRTTLNSYVDLSYNPRAVTKTPGYTPKRGRKLRYSMRS